jgi:hypothetical protein
MNRRNVLKSLGALALLPLFPLRCFQRSRKGRIIHTVRSGRTSDLGIWEGGQAPTKDDTVVIRQEHDITVDCGLSCKLLVFKSSQFRPFVAYR